MRRLPWIALALALACVLAQAAGPAVVATLAFRRPPADLLHALSGQWVHWSWSHAFANAAVMALCGAWLERRLGHARLALFALLAWLGGAVCLLLWEGGLDEYRGASGLAANWLTLTLIQFAAVRSPRRKLGLALAAAVLFSLPAWLGQTSAVLPPGVRPVWELHFAMALLAGVMASYWPAAPSDAAIDSKPGLPPTP